MGIRREDDTVELHIKDKFFDDVNLIKNPNNVPNANRKIAKQYLEHR